MNSRAALNTGENVFSCAVKCYNCKYVSYRNMGKKENIAEVYVWQVKAKTNGNNVKIIRRM